MFYAIPNLSSISARKLEKPWEYTESAIPDTVTSKEKFRTWCMDTRTHHAFISPYEPMTPELRVSKDRENFVIGAYGLLVDYDSDVSDDMFQQCIDRPVSEFRPAYGVRTFSGHARLWWNYGRLIRFTCDEQRKEFLKIAFKILKLDRWLPAVSLDGAGDSLDVGAFEDTSHYFEVGKKWIPLYPDYTIPKPVLDLWLWEASKRSKFMVGGDNYEVPLEDVKKELEVKFPGRWSGPFELGSRGVRFWDPTSNDPTGAVVTPHGMMAYSGEQAHMSWRQIFGPEFIQRYESAKIAKIADQAVYDGKKYWLKHDKEWKDMDKSDFALQLKRMGFSQKKKVGHCTEIENVITSVQLERRVYRALPFQNRPEGLIVYNGDQYLNISKVKCIPPAPLLPGGKKLEFADGKTYFRTIYTLLTAMFCEPNDKSGPDQLEHMLSEIKHYYEWCYRQCPPQAHVIVLAGIANAGKTLFTQRVVGAMMGGSTDVAHHLSEGDVWTEDCVKYPVLAVHDPEGSSNYMSHARFTMRLKRYAANCEVTYNQKYVQTGNVPVFPFIWITINTDPESISSIPSMDNNTKQKIALYKTGNYVLAFKERSENEAAIARELPYFARFLLDWEYPEHVLSVDRRFHVVAYHHPELLNESQQQGLCGSLSEVLIPYLSSWSKEHKNADTYEGTAAELYAELQLFNGPVMRSMSLRGFSVALGVYVRNGYNLDKYRGSDGLYRWKINIKLFHHPDEATGVEDLEDRDRVSVTEEQVLAGTYGKVIEESVKEMSEEKEKGTPDEKPV